MFVPAASNASLAQHERRAVRAAEFDQLVAARREEAQRRYDQRLAQGFSQADALAFVARDLRAGRRALVMRDVTRMEVRELL
jgi:uncharacterized protein YoaH (UPF0181 family)